MENGFVVTARAESMNEDDFIVGCVSGDAVFVIGLMSAVSEVETRSGDFVRCCSRRRRTDDGDRREMKVS
ncbi:hypothetical protein L1987_15885 [Smallanthus sonchifolius]|uniref:Uncharacterized protein n=1 Tax=Smallanthus sonchifolius TaxID=185202 RepID=A0ACB9J7C0_9ASTR|nr:hypothetical protein L1987_15885 [Smallanthus sonchifolius]